MVLRIREIGQTNMFCYRDGVYLVSNTRLDIYFSVYQCAQFTNNTKASHDTAVKRICWYLQDTKDTCMKGLLGHENPQYPIYAMSRTGFVVTFSKCYLLWVSKPHSEVSLSKINYEYAELSNSVVDLIPLNSLIKEVIKTFVINSEKLNIMSRPTIYEDNNGAIIM